MFDHPTAADYAYANANSAREDAKKITRYVEEVLFPALQEVRLQAGLAPLPTFAEWAGARR